MIDDDIDDLLNRMLYSDWLKNFEQVQICNLSPDSFQGQLTAQQV